MKTTTLMLAAALALAGLAALAPAASADDRCVTNDPTADLCYGVIECPGHLWTTWFMGRETEWRCA